MPALGFAYRGDTLHCEDVPLKDVATLCGTPCYVYSATSIASNYRSYTEALADLPHEIHYAVKANGRSEYCLCSRGREPASTSFRAGSCFA